MHGGGPFYSRALRGGNAGLCKEREREVTAWHGGRVSVLARATRHHSDVAVATALRGGDAEDVCESASRPLLDFGVLNDNLIKCLISFVEVYEQILSNRYKGIHGYITRSTIMMKMELRDQCA
jgi:hypothetical protein